MCPCVSSFARLMLGVVLLACAGGLLRAGDELDSPASSIKATDEAGPGHSQHGEAFNEGPRQAAYLMGGTGDVHFPVTTKSELAQKFFDQGIGQLHGFWYFEAERSFRQVLLLDPDCAMAYWGMAMANENNDQRAKKFIDKAVTMKAGVTPREAAWIDAVAGWYKGEDTKEVRRKYIRDLEAIVQTYPDDVEAKAFLVVQIWMNSSSVHTESRKQWPIPSYQAVDALLDQIFQAQPMHPAHHYRIHLWDNEKPERALVSASLGGQSAPAIAHMWHMPGHTFSKVHRYADAAWQQEASARVDHAHMMRDRVMPYQIFNYAHNNEWLIRDLAIIGRARDAIDLARNMIDLPQHPELNNVSKRGSANYGHTRLADVLLQYECWNEILALKGTRYLLTPKTADERVKQMRLFGLAAIGVGDLDEGRRLIAEAESQLAEKRAARATSNDEAKGAKAEAGQDEQPVADSAGRSSGRRNSDSQALERLLSELNAYLALASGEQAKALTELEKLKDVNYVRKDQLARAISLAGDHAGAEALARTTVEKRPGEVFPLAVLVDVLFRAGKNDEARAQFEKLRPLAAFADLDMPVFARLAAAASQFGLPADWRGSRETPSDAGVRPDLASLGPFRWQPSPAPDWAGVDIDGSPRSLSQLRGRPQVLIFYLGSGCLHCVEQVQTFSKLSDKFAAAGIDLLAISSEPLDSLRASRGTLLAGEAVRFPLVADPELSAFKAYRCFDDFERMPLHGTFLIDGEGLVRWQDISYEPFLDAQFLLDEARRLLAN